MRAHNVLVEVRKAPTVPVEGLDKVVFLVLAFRVVVEVTLLRFPSEVDDFEVLVADVEAEGIPDADTDGEADAAADIAGPSSRARVVDAMAGGCSFTEELRRTRSVGGTLVTVPETLAASTVPEALTDLFGSRKAEGGIVRTIRTRS